MSDATGTGLKRAALAFLAIPMLILAVFAVGEVVAGDRSGVQHVAQLVPLAALNALLLFAPPLVAGILFVAAARRQHPTHVGGQGGT